MTFQLESKTGPIEPEEAVETRGGFFPATNFVTFSRPSGPIEQQDRPLRPAANHVLAIEA